MTPAEVETIRRCADAAQTGRWPNTAQLLDMSTATRLFVESARRDVLALCAEVRRLHREAAK